MQTRHRDRACQRRDAIGHRQIQTDRDDLRRIDRIHRIAAQHECRGGLADGVAEGAGGRTGIGAVPGVVGDQVVAADTAVGGKDVATARSTGGASRAGEAAGRLHLDVAAIETAVTAAHRIGHRVGGAVVVRGGCGAGHADGDRDADHVHQLGIRAGTTGQELAVPGVGGGQGLAAFGGKTQIAACCGQADGAARGVVTADHDAAGRRPGAGRDGGHIGADGDRLQRLRRRRAHSTDQRGGRRLGDAVFIIVIAADEVVIGQEEGVVDLRTGGARRCIEGRDAAAVQRDRAQHIGVTGELHQAARGNGRRRIGGDHGGQANALAVDRRIGRGTDTSGAEQRRGGCRADGHRIGRGRTGGMEIGGGQIAHRQRLGQRGFGRRDGFGITALHRGQQLRGVIDASEVQ
ncbi:MAG: hypothetical protein BWZ07_02052 [Alphaproteobacteria bacterium ADurb.BinA280]|nr:MAG: hypothetical protein BWZ07_02052 [Alphaproteobacteria bacterium ADurb.BinA280]